MYQEERQIYYDRDLNIEAYNLSGIVQKFPNHFHEDYVIGLTPKQYQRIFAEHESSLLNNPKERQHAE